MSYRVIWSEFSEIQLDAIFDFYLKEAGPNIAKKIIAEIISEANRLANSPEIGQIEPLLLHRTVSYRYLISNNYKIIYSIDDQEKYIKIADVFDTRQNPQKISRTK